MKVSEVAKNEFKKSFRSLFFGILLSCLSSLASVTLMGAAGYFLTMMGIAGFLGVSCNIFILSALIRLCALLRTLLRYIERIINHKLTFMVIEKWRTALFSKVLNLSYDDAAKLKSHDVERVLRHDIAVIEALYIKQALPIICAFILGLALGFFLCAFSYLLAFTTLGLMFLGAVLAPLVLLKLKGRLKLQEAFLEERLHRQSGNLILGLFDLLTVGALEKVFYKVSKLSRRKATLHAKFVLYEDLLNALLTTLASLTLPLAFLIVIPLFNQGLLSGSQVVCLAIVAMAAFEWVMAVPSSLISFKESLLSLRRIYFLEQKGTKSVKTLTNVTIGSKVQQVTFKNISFYRENLELFKDFNYCFRSDTNYLIQGPIGCGKTTLILLFAGILEPKLGEIFLDEQKYESGLYKKWREHYALSLQEISFLPGTIKSISQEGKTEASEEECWHALELATLDKVIRKLPQGLDTYLGGATLLSGGELRRLCIARSLIANKEFLILDEPFEGLDDKTSLNLIDNVLKSRRGVIIISHKTLLSKLDNLEELRLKRNLI